MKLPGSPRVLKSANNILFGLSLISGFLMAFQDTPAHSRGQGFAREASGYTWLGFLTLWVISMVIGFVCEFLKREGRILLYTLRASCGLGVVHVLCVPFMFLL
ncbi:MAG: hypothetical protein RLZZ15_208 [Verrucomicrobiota bacterium]|jgi:hypothetical protein